MIFLQSAEEICMIMCPIGCVSRCVQKGWIRIGDVLNINIFKHPPKSCVKCTSTGPLSRALIFPVCNPFRREAATADATNCCPTLYLSGRMLS